MKWFCCGKSHWGAVCPDGKVMCQLCYSRFGVDDLYVDAAGDKQDVCVSCGIAEEQVLRDRKDRGIL